MLEGSKQKTTRENDLLAARIKNLEAENQAKIEIMRQESERKKERED
jgi:hypothetical protein